MAGVSLSKNRTERMNDPGFPPAGYDCCLADLERLALIP
jgi:hypothetical protein